MHRGWVRLYRKIQDNPIWQKERFTRGQAWVDLFMLANWQDSFFIKRGQRVDVLKGQVGISIKGLADRWKWSEGKVDRFLTILSTLNEPQIEYQKTNVTTIITIINWEKYQGDGDQNGAQTETKRRPNGDQTETYNKDKKLKKLKKEYISPHLGEHKNVKITESELISLIEYVGGKDRALDLIERLSSYMASKNKHYANHYATMQTWHRKDKSENKGAGIVATASKEYI